MAYLTLDEAKKHLNVDFSDDDQYITSLVDAAEASVENYIQTSLSDYVQGDKLNPALLHAIKLVVGNLYSNRESIAYAVPQAIPYTLTFLLQPFIKYS